MKPGSVVTLNFPGVSGFKRRPAIVVSTDTYHAERPDVILAAVTSKIRKTTAKTDYILQDWLSAGLNQPSTVRIFLGTRPRGDVTEIGELSNRDWMEVRKRLQLSLDI